MHRLSMVFVLHAPLVFASENHIESFIFEQKLICEHLDHRKKTVMHGTLCFAIENVAERLVFLKKKACRARISVQNRRVRRPFHSKREVCDAMQLSQPSQTRDLANPLGIEPLSL